MKPILIERSEDQRSNAKPKVSINKSGTFFVNHQAMDLMKVTEPVKIQIFQDAEDSKLWYLHINETEGYVTMSIKSGNSKKPAAQFTMSDISRKIKESFFHDGDSTLRFFVQEPKEYEGKHYFPLKVIPESINIKLPEKEKKPYEFSKKPH